MKILITGGLGFIGAVTARLFLDNGFDVEILDYGKGGVSELPEALAGVKLYKVDIRDVGVVRKIVGEGGYDGVIHFAGRVEAGLSIVEPFEFYGINAVGTLNLLEAMREFGVSRIVFSSTAAVYGNPESLPINEEMKLEPINVYGESKLVAERLLENYGRYFGLRSVALRYFNASGAWPEVGLFEKHLNETHLIPRIGMALRDDVEFKLFGDDYSTPDGTCVRDYVHVRDLAVGHLSAWRYLVDGGASIAVNLGNSKGFSNLEVVRACEEVVGKKLKLEVEKRRVGDPDVLVADNSRALELFGWRTEFSDLMRIVGDSWRGMVNG